MDITFLDPDNKNINTSSLTSVTHYSILDYSDKKDIDFMFEPLMMLEGFESYGIEVVFENDIKLVLPYEWSILCSDYDTASPIQLYSFRGREFTALTMNPIKSSMPEFIKCRTERILPTINWNTPPIEEKKLFTIPLNYDKIPMCIFATRSFNDTGFVLGELF